MNWQGQFNLDFFMFLLMSGSWIAWRNRFSPSGIGLGIGGVFLGAPYLTAYLLYLGHRHEWDFKKGLFTNRMMKLEKEKQQKRIGCASL